MAQKLDLDSMKRIALFEKITRAQVKDCFEATDLTFVLYPGQMGLAIGKGGQTIKKVEGLLKRKVRLIEFSEDISVMVGKLVAPTKIAGADIVDGVLRIWVADSRVAGKVYGRSKENIPYLQTVLSRYFSFSSIEVLEKQ